MKQWGYLFNEDACIGCRACELACHNKNQTSAEVRWRRVTPLANGSFLSLSCNHCENPECFRVCPQRAFVKRYDGIVLINSELCNGCMLCVSACPYHAPQYDPVKNRVTKCNLCVECIDQGELPACIEACTTGSLQLIDLNDEQTDDTVDRIEGMPDIRLTRPSIRFYPAQQRKKLLLKIHSDNESKK